MPEPSHDGVRVHAVDPDAGALPAPPRAAGPGAPGRPLPRRTRRCPARRRRRSSTRRRRCRRRAPGAIITRAAARLTRNEPRAITRAARPSLRCRLDQRRGLRSPALFTTMSTPPYAGTPRATPHRPRPRRSTSTLDAAARSRRPISAATFWPRRRRGRRRRRPRLRRRSARAIARPMPEAAPVTSATRPASGCAGGRPPQLRLLERPVLDAELLGFGDRLVRRDRLGAAHDVDRVDVELAGDARGLGVRAEAEHADARHEHDRRVGAAHRRRCRRGVPPIVGRVLGAVLSVQLAQPRDAVDRRAAARRSRKQRPHLRAQEVVGARRAERDEPRRRLAGDEVEHHGRVDEAARRSRRSVEHRPAEHRREPRRDAPALRRGSGSRPRRPGRTAPVRRGRR